MTAFKTLASSLMPVLIIFAGYAHSEAWIFLTVARKMWLQMRQRFHSTISIPFLQNRQEDPKKNYPYIHKIRYTLGCLSHLNSWVHLLSDSEWISYGLMGSVGGQCEKQTTDNSSGKQTV